MNCVVTWQAEDIDSDVLFFDVYYSNNNGADWDILASEFEESYLYFPTDGFAGGDYKLKILEKDNELKGKGNSYNFGARFYDPRISRWASIDPEFEKFTEYSPYIYCLNSPIKYIDPDGENPRVGNKWPKTAIKARNKAEIRAQQNLLNYLHKYQKSTRSTQGPNTPKGSALTDIILPQLQFGIILKTNPSLIKARNDARIALYKKSLELEPGEEIFVEVTYRYVGKEKESMLDVAYEWKYQGFHPYTGDPGLKEESGSTVIDEVYRIGGPSIYQQYILEEISNIEEAEQRSLSGSEINKIADKWSKIESREQMESGSMSQEERQKIEEDYEEK